MIRVLSFCVCQLASVAIWAQQIQTPTAAPESVGISSEQLARIDQMIQTRIDAGELIGAVTLIGRDGYLVHNSALGLMDRENGRPMTTGTPFKIASMSKPVTAVAILMLAERGLLRLDDPVEKFLPGFSELTLAESLDAAPTPRGQVPPYRLIEPARAITIRDLLTHTSGLGSGAMSNDSILRAAPSGTTTLADYIPRLGQSALEFQPGSRWAYSAFAGFDTLGYLVEIISGKPFDQFLEQEIFEPLGMDEIYFWPPEDDWSRIASGYRSDSAGILQPTQNPVGRSSPDYFSGSAGLISSGEAYMPLAMLLANGGELNGVRLLSRKSVELMAALHVKEDMPGRRPGEGFGLGVRVISDPAERVSFMSPGSFGWFGATGTFLIIDPQERLAAVLMVQTPNGEISQTFEMMAAQAIAD